ncbi:hypothetical protein [Robbsia andropogonis]|nr:hypothetical protein [Robbsia andropogonis]MCP1117016.1 hypothetical protein [Robbsia andropogonis]MCP1126305.1 hypothetical protein [Robbsia andropogonis]
MSEIKFTPNYEIERTAPRRRIHWGSFVAGAVAMLLTLAAWNALSLGGYL